MDEKTLTTIEFFKVIDALAVYAAFSASAELARQLRPAPDLETASLRLARTTEARHLLSVKAESGIGGAHDIRSMVRLASRGGVLSEADLLAVSGTLVSSRSLYRSFEKNSAAYPHLYEIVRMTQPPAGIIEAINRCISDRAEVLDSASPRLASIRSEVKTAHDRLLSRLEKMITDPHTGPMLQEGIITQRNGRYVIPIRAEFKNRIKSIVHDQSSSGATLFVEPIGVVELNNRWHELQLAERDEVHRILAQLSEQVGAEAEAISGIVDALAEFDLALMCAKYADALKASEPILLPIHPPAKAHHPGTTLRLLHVRHPLLNPDQVVPVDLELDEDTFAVVITGPNTGGKTVTLKSVGLMVAMAQSGLHIPAQSGSELSFFEDLFADIGDEQSIEQSLSTFSGHITNIVRILNRAKSNTLVLLDELGAGTDPQEGSALARAILLYLVDKRIPCLIATHYPELKALAHATPGVVNASMEFNLKTLKPTYHLTLGIPGRSNALAIARRLHLPEEILESARTMINPDELKAEDLLNEIHHQREVARNARSAADRDRSLAQNLKAELATRLEKIEEERQAEMSKAREEAEAELEEVQAEIEQVRRELARARQPLEALRGIQEKTQVIEEKVEKKIARRPLVEAGSTTAFKVGDRVRLVSLKLEGVITSLSEVDAEVQVGNLRIRVHLNELQRPHPVEEPQNLPVQRQASPAANPPFRASPGMEIDLRGQRAEDAVEALDRYLENAFLAGMPFVRIIHGKGTGKLRQVIREALAQSPHVSRFESGADAEGGDGVTIAHLE